MKGDFEKRTEEFEDDSTKSASKIEENKPKGTLSFGEFAERCCRQRDEAKAETETAAAAQTLPIAKETAAPRGGTAVTGTVICRTRPKAKASSREDDKVTVKVPDVLRARAAVAREEARVQKEEIKKLSSEFNTSPEGTSLSAPGHGKIDTSIMWVMEDGEGVELTSSYGISRIIPWGDDSVRIKFYKKTPVKTEDEGKLLSPFFYVDGSKPEWSLQESREKAEIILNRLIVSVDKKTGIISFLTNQGCLLLSEKSSPARQYHSNEKIWWQFFDWGKRELLSAWDGKNRKDVTGSAKYISHGSASDLEAVIISNKGYRIIMPAKIKTLFCGLQAYGPYIRFEETDGIDFIFQFL